MKNTRSILVSLLMILMISSLRYTDCQAQDAKTLWDNQLSKNWPEGFSQVDIKSSADGTSQKAVVYWSRLPDPRPLIISLHTWSGDYLQEDTPSQDAARSEPYNF